MDFFQSAILGAMTAVILLIVYVAISEARRRKEWQEITDRQDREETSDYFDRLLRFSLGNGDDAHMSNFEDADYSSI